MAHKACALPSAHHKGGLGFRGPHSHLVCRCLFCLGIVGSLAQAAGEGAKLLFQHWASDLAPLVAATAASCWPALARPIHLREACRAADMWAEETGALPGGALFLACQVYNVKNLKCLQAVHCKARMPQVLVIVVMQEIGGHTPKSQD